MSSSSDGNNRGRPCEFTENLEILREIRFFSAFPLESHKLFAYLCTRETFKPGDNLFSQDDDDGRAFYIVDGTAQVLRTDDGEERIIRECGHGEFIGGLALLGTMNRLFSLQAATDMTCLVITREKFSRAIERFPELMPKIFKALVDGIRQWEQHFLIDCDRECVSCRENVGVSLL